MLGFAKKTAPPPATRPGSAGNALNRLKMVIHADRAANIPMELLERIKVGFRGVLRECLGIDDCELDLHLCQADNADDDGGSLIRAEIPIANFTRRK